MVNFNSFVNKKYDTLYEIIKEREQNMADSMYLNDIDSKARFNSIIEDAENGFSPMPLPLDKVLKIQINCGIMMIFISKSIIYGLWENNQVIVFLHK